MDLTTCSDRSRALFGQQEEADPYCTADVPGGEVSDKAVDPAPGLSEQSRMVTKPIRLFRPL